jgi:hypothetical protein
MRSPVFMVVLFLSQAAIAQNAFYKNTPGELLLVQKTCTANCDALEGAVYKTKFQKGVAIFAEREKLSIKVVNHSDKPLYYSIIDLQPDNTINVLAPYDDNPPAQFHVGAHDTIEFAAEVIITPPYGVDKLVTIFSEQPLDFGPLFRGSSIRSIGIPSGTNPVQELTWILQGTPSPVFAACKFGITDLVIIPAKKSAAINSLHRSWASQPLSFFPADDCTAAMREPEKLYAIYPLISLIQPLQAGVTRGIKPEHKVATRAFVLKGTAVAMKGIKSVQVNAKTGQLKMLTEQQYFWEKEVQLQEGRNQFQVLVETTDGKVNCEDVAVNYEPDKGAVTRAGADHLLLIGINEYEQWTKLRGARRDVDSIEALLTGSFGFAGSNVHKLVDANGTKEAIDSVFRYLISTLGPSDNLVVYYAGHGMLDKQVNEGYWIPVDARLRKSVDYVSNTEIKKYLEALKTKHTLLIADACFSGGFFKTNRGEKFEDKIGRLGSRWVLCSGREEEVADLMAGTGHSPFAFYLMKTLRGSTGGISASQLFQDVKVAVAGNSNQTPVGGPVSNVGDEGGEYVFRKK